MGACLHDVLARAAAQTPGVLALVSGETSHTFAGLHARVQRAAAFLDDATDPGARVAVVGENHPAWVECYYAVPAVGRVLVFGNHRLAPAELRSVLERSGASMAARYADRVAIMATAMRTWPGSRTTTLYWMPFSFDRRRK